MRKIKYILFCLSLTACTADTGTNFSGDNLFNNVGGSDVGGSDVSDGAGGTLFVGTSNGGAGGSLTGTGGEEECTCVLPHAKTVCINNECYLDECAPGYSDCNGDVTDGCELNSYVDEQNCGTCNNICITNNAQPECVAGECTCELNEDNKCTCYGTHFGDCDTNRDNGCEANFLTDQFNCGECGHQCHNVAYCQGMSCKCDAAPDYSSNQDDMIQPCYDCIKSSCCDKFTACMNDQECSQHWDTWTAFKFNGGGGCFGCGEPPILNAHWAALRTCLQQATTQLPNCLSVCGG